MQKAQAQLVLPHFFTSALTLWVEASALLAGMISQNGNFTHTHTHTHTHWSVTGLESEQSNKD